MDTKTIMLIVAAVLFLVVAYIIFVQVIKNKKINSKTYDLSIDIDQLILALKGYNNIKEVSATQSKVRFELEDTNVDVDTIKTLGASGIVESNSSLTIIFGKQSQAICDYIKDHQ